MTTDADSLLFALPAAPNVAVVGRDRRYPVHRIFCVGRNYAEHAAEMGVEVDRRAPFYFLKQAGAIVPSGATIPYPPGTRDFHHEMELVVALGAPAHAVPVERAMDVVFGYACGLDMTRRDLQLAARAERRPWDLGKDFEASAVVAPIVPKENFGPVTAQTIALTVDGVTRQRATLAELVWSVAELVSHLSGYYRLGPGDLIFTGTPAGVGPVIAGDHVVGTIDGLPAVELMIAAAQTA